MIFRYFSFASRVAVFAAASSKPKKRVRFLRKDGANNTHMPIGIPAYFIFYPSKPPN